MNDFLKILVDTPIPTILVLSGLFFMLLSLVDRLIERISIPEQRRALSLKVGIFLTVVGAVMWVLPSLIDVPPSNSHSAGSTPTTPSTGLLAEGGTGTPPKSFLVQLAAVSSFGSATNAANVYLSAHATILDGLSPNIEPVDDASHGTLYRVRFGPIDTSAKADAVCRQLIASGASDCRVVPLE